MKVIFLDVDGVLNAWGPEPSGLRDILNFETILPETIEALNAIVSETGARVVVSSSWRTQYPIWRFNEELKNRGFIGEVIGRTPELWRNAAGQRYQRGDEIVLWLRHRPEVTSFAILDDETNLSRVIDRLVQTDPQYGLTALNAEQAIQLLENRSLADYPIPSATTVIVERCGLFAAMRDQDRQFKVSFPGGRIDTGETSADAAQREVFEETGLIVGGLHSLGRRKATSMVCECFVATEAEGELRASHEGPVLWATREQILTGAYPEWSVWAFVQYDAFCSQQ